MTSKRHARLLLGASLASGAAAWATAVTAHDFFLLPSAFVAEAGETITLSATVSAAFPKLETPVARDRMATATAAGAAGVGPLQAGADGKLRLQARSPGVAVGATSAVAREVEYPEDRIDLILGEYDIEGAAAAAAKALPRPRILKVVSQRFAKTLVCVAGCPDRAAASVPVGHALEFVAADPAWRRFTLLSDGKPVADHPVAVGHAGGREHLRTDREGRVSLPALAGPVMLFAAEMSAPLAPGGRFELRLAALTLSR